jgi:hypothetical protein
MNKNKILYAQYTINDGHVFYCLLDDDGAVQESTQYLNDSVTKNTIVMFKRFDNELGLQRMKEICHTQLLNIASEIQFLREQEALDDTSIKTIVKRMR